MNLDGAELVYEDGPHAARRRGITWSRARHTFCARLELGAAAADGGKPTNGR